MLTKQQKKTIKVAMAHKGYEYYKDLASDIGYSLSYLSRFLANKCDVGPDFIKSLEKRLSIKLQLK